MNTTVATSRVIILCGLVALHGVHAFTVGSLRHQLGGTSPTLPAVRPSPSHSLLLGAKKKKPKATDESFSLEETTTDDALDTDSESPSVVVDAAELDLNKTIDVIIATQQPGGDSKEIDKESTLDTETSALEMDESAPSVDKSNVGEEVQQESSVSQPTASNVQVQTDDPSTATPIPESLLSEEQNKLISYLQTLGAITGRGEYASPKQKASAMDVLEKLEAMNPTPNTALSPSMSGRWELVYSSTQLFRSSPFFMAGRSVCATEQQAKQYNWFCDMHRKALAMSTIVGVRQIVSKDKLVSEFEVKAGAVPFLSDFTPFRYSGGLPVSIDGAIVSTADLTPLGDAWSLYMDTVEIKGSNVPGIRQLLDSGLKLQSRALGDFLEERIDSYDNPRPCFRTTFLNDQFRISRDEDGHAFFYVKTSENTMPTDYSAIDADLGIGRLLEGLNDAVTRFYL